METMVRPPRTGLEAFELLPEGTLCQLINDAIIMSPAPNTPHAIVQKAICFALLQVTENENLGEVLFAPIDVYLNTKNVYQPDILFISTARIDIIKERGVFGAPDLVIEILSENRRYDLLTKKKVYEQSGVMEYWVVDPVTKWCEGFELIDGHYHSMGKGVGVLNVKCFCLEIKY